MTVGQMIKEKRKTIGLTQREFAKEIGIATITLQQYERGVREPKLEMLMRIANGLKCSVRDFLDEIDDSGGDSCSSSEQLLFEVESIQEKRLLMLYRPLSDNGKEQVISFCGWVNASEGKKTNNGFDAEHDIHVDVPQPVLDLLKLNQDAPAGDNTQSAGTGDENNQE